MLDINQVSRLNLSRYRMIAVKNPGALTDETIGSITQWLKESPGVLYVHLDLTADNSQQFATPEHFDGRLKLNWPWGKRSERRTEFVQCRPIPLTPGSPSKAHRSNWRPPARAFTVPEGVVARTFKTPVEICPRDLCTSNGEPRAGRSGSIRTSKRAVVFDGIDGGGKIYREQLRLPRCSGGIENEIRRGDRNQRPHSS